MHEEFNVLKCIAKYCIGHEWLPTEELSPYMKMKVIN